MKDDLAAASAQAPGLDAFTLAAYEHVDELKPRADGAIFGAPVWHGWAVREAFLAGARFALDAAARMAEDKMHDEDIPGDYGDAIRAMKP